MFKKAWRLLVTEERSTKAELDALRRELKVAEAENLSDPATAQLRLKDIEARTTALTERVRTDTETMEKWNKGLAQATVALELAILAIGLVLIRGSSAVHLDYYSAAAAISPVLLIAGLVEIGTLGLSGGIWKVLSFSLPVSVAGTAALVALAIHRSTASLAYLTAWGLGVTLLALTGYAVLHAYVSGRSAGRATAP